LTRGRVAVDGGDGAAPDLESERMSEAAQSKPQVGVIMGSSSDWPTMSHAAEMLERFELPYESRIVSAHRTPERMVAYAQEAESRGLRVIIAGAGGAAHLPGMVAALTIVPVLGVPVESRALSGWDSLLSIAQMPGGVPVGTLAIGKSGATNAGLLAVAILAGEDADLAERLRAYRRQRAEEVAAQSLPSVAETRGEGGRS
jgi:5-(carboxyamino)imidazole ribonucleotide mutase